jgi:hypothetical protein
LSEDHSIRLPLTQTDIADPHGLTSQGLRRDGLITLAHRRLSLHHVERLQNLAQRNPDYLHLAGVPAAVERYLEGRVRQEAPNPRRIAG